MEIFDFFEIAEEHLVEVMGIYNYYVMNTTATFSINPLAIDEIRNMLFFDDPRFKTYVIKDKSGICGYCLLSPHNKREAYRQTGEITVYLKPSFTGKGVGKAAIEFMEKEARENDFHVLVAVICAENENSIRLFKRNGYEKCAHYKEIGKKFGRILDVVCYQKILNHICPK
jgi:L-amino acid N-acyltransferase YncA